MSYSVIRKLPTTYRNKLSTCMVILRTLNLFLPSRQRSLMCPLLPWFLQQTLRCLFYAIFFKRRTSAISSDHSNLKSFLSLNLSVSVIPLNFRKFFEMKEKTYFVGNQKPLNAEVDNYSEWFQASLWMKIIFEK